MDDIARKYLKEILLALALLSAAATVFFVQKYPYFLAGEIPYDFYVTLINYNDFGFVKRGFLNTIFVSIGLDLTDKPTHLIVRGALMVALFGYGFYQIRKMALLHGKSHPIEIIFIAILLAMGPGGQMHFAKILIPHLALFLFYFIAIEYLFRSNAPNTILLSIISAIGVLQHEIWIFVSLPLLLVIHYDKTGHLKGPIVVAVTSAVTLLLCREFGNMSFTDEALFEKMTRHFPKMKTEYTINYEPHYFNTNIWTKTPKIEYERIFERRYEIFIPLFCMAKLALAKQCLDQSKSNHKWLWLSALSCVFLCFIFGTDYGRWSSYFVINSVLVFFYCFRNDPFVLNRKLMLFCLSFLVIFKPFYYNITYIFMPSQWLN